MVHAFPAAASSRQAAASALATRLSRRGSTRLFVRRLALAVAQRGARLERHASRLADLIVAGTALVLCSPVALPLLAIALLSNGGLAPHARVGRHGRPVRVLAWPTGGRFWTLAHRIPGVAGLPVLLNVVRGQLALVGPRAAAPGEFPLRSRQGRRRVDPRPGLACLHRLRGLTNIAYRPELEADIEYADTHSLGGDLALLVRTMLASLYGGPTERVSREVSVLGLRVDNLTMDEAVERAVVALDDRSRHVQVSFVNAHCANVAVGDADYRRAIRTSGLVLADGIGMKLAGSLLGKPIVENVNGTDMLPRLCTRLGGRRVFLLGGHEGVAETVADFMRSQNAHIEIAGTRHGFFAQEDEAQVAADIRATGAELLLVAMGVPRQDVWIARHLEATGARVAIGVGGLFDFYSNRVPRAPLWMRELALEWVYRLYQEPGRMWRRYVVGNAVFMGRVLGTRLAGRAA